MLNNISQTHQTSLNLINNNPRNLQEINERTALIQPEATQASEPEVGLFHVTLGSSVILLASSMLLNMNGNDAAGKITFAAGFVACAAFIGVTIRDAISSNN